MFLRKNRFAENAVIYSLSNAIGKGVPFLLLPVLTRYLTPSDYGIIATFQVIFGLMAVFIGVNTNGAIMVNFFTLNTKELQNYVGNALLIIFFNVIWIFSLIFFVGRHSSKIFGISESWMYVALLVASGQIIISLILVLWQTEQKAIWYGLFNTLCVIANVSVSLILIVVFGWNWKGRVLGIALAISLFSFIALYLMFRRRYAVLSLNTKHLRDLASFGVPLIPHALGGWIITGLDRIFINSMVSIGATGIYAVGYQVGMIISLMANSFNTAWAPFLFGKLKGAEHSTKLKIVKLTYLYCFLILTCAVGLGLVSPTFLGFFVDEKFYGASKYVIWIALGYAFNGIYLVVGNYIFYVKKTYLLSVVTFSMALLNTCLNYIFIKRFGALGAAQATCITYFGFCFLTWFLSSRVYPMPWKISLREIWRTKIVCP